VEEFEHEFAQAHGKRFGVACNSGTSALHLALMACDLRQATDYGPASHVVCPAMGMVAIPNAVLSAGGRPVFVDSEHRTGNMDAFWISSLPQTVIAQHLYGVPIEFCIGKANRDRTWIEDCAEAHYATFADGSPVGSRGDLACFSFFANKIITSGGEGGMVLTNDESTAARLRGLRAHAFTAGEHFHHSEHAYGMRMTDLQGAIGLAQHRRRAEFIDRRKAIGLRYMAGLSGLPWIQMQQRTPGSAWWVFPVLVVNGFGVSRDSVREHLAAAGVETRTWFKPLHRQPHLARYANGQAFPVAEGLYRCGLYLPIYYSMTDSDVDYIIERLARLQP
jgi:perosamine synthetase